MAFDTREALDAHIAKIFRDARERTQAMEDRWSEEYLRKSKEMIYAMLAESRAMQAQAANEAASVAASNASAEAERLRQLQTMPIPQDLRLSAWGQHWQMSQPDEVRQLYMECAIADDSGLAFRPLTTKLKVPLFLKAKKVIIQAQLFSFKRDPSYTGRSQVRGHLVRNLYGADLRGAVTVEVDRSSL